MDKILISACFLGDLVRYDEKTKALAHPLLLRWYEENRLIKICPEMAGGLSVPRAAAEINPETLKITTENKVDVTKAFHLGAERALALCKTHKICFALLKESSPSCGSQLIYDGSFSNTKISGQGITTQVLRANGIEVFSENSIEALARRIT